MGREGLEEGDWVMKGGKNWWNYVRDLENGIHFLGINQQNILKEKRLLSPRTQLNYLKQKVY